MHDIHGEVLIYTSRLRSAHLYLDLFSCPHCETSYSLVAGRTLSNAFKKASTVTLISFASSRCPLVWPALPGQRQTNLLLLHFHHWAQHLLAWSLQLSCKLLEGKDQALCFSCILPFLSAAQCKGSIAVNLSVLIMIISAELLGGRDSLTAMAQGSSSKGVSERVAKPRP